MAPSSRLCHSPRRNLLTNQADNELANNSAKASTESSGSLASTSCALTLRPVLNAFFAFVSTLGPVFIANRYTDKDLQRTTKLVLESFHQGQEYGQAQAAAALAPAPAQLELYKRLLKACFP